MEAPKKKLIKKKKAKYFQSQEAAKENPQVEKEQPEKQQQKNSKYSYLVNAIEPDDTIGSIYTGGRILCGKELIYANCDNKIVVHNPSTLTQTTQFVQDNEQIVNFCLNNSETQIVTFTNSYLLRLLDINTKKEQHILKINKYFVIDMAFSPNDKYIAVGCVNSAVKILTVSTWKQTHQYKNHRFSVRRVEWHPDPNKLQLISLDQQQNLNIFDYMLNQVVHTIPSFGINFLITPTGKSIIGCDKSIKVWDYRSLKLMHEYQVGEQYEIQTICLINENNLLFAGQNVHLGIVNLNNNVMQPIQGLTVGPLMKIMTLRGHSKKILLVSHEQNIFVVSQNHNNFTLENTLLGFNDEITDVKFSKSDSLFDRDNQMLVVATNSSLIKLVELKNKHSHLISGHKEIVMSVDYCYPYIVSGSKDKTVKLWKIDSQADRLNMVKMIANYKGHSEDVVSVVMAPINQFIVSVSEDKTIKLWPWPSSDKIDVKASLFTVVAHEKSINSVRLNQNETMIATCSQDRTIKVWDSKNLSLKMVLKGHKRSVWDVSFNKIQKILVSGGGDGTIKLWNLTNGQCLSTMGEGKAILRLQWLYHNQVIAGTVDGLVKIWDIRKMTSNTFDKHEGKIWSLDVSPQDDNGDCMIVSGANDSRIIFWKDVTEQKRQEDMERLSKVEQDKFIYNRYVSQLDFLNAAKIAFESEMTEMFIKASGMAVSKFNEEIDSATFQDGQIIVNTANRDGQLNTLAAIVQFCMGLDMNRLLKIIQDMNTTVRHFKLANLLFRQVISQQTLNSLTQLNKTYNEQRSKVKGTAGEFTQDKSDFQQFVERMRLLNERHATRLENYIRDSYWIDYSWGKSEEL